MEYWKECVSEALEDAGIEATAIQIEIIASWVEGAHENYGMAHGHDVIRSQDAIDKERLELELKQEKEKIICAECGGSGRSISHGPYHSAESACFKCRGEGRTSRYA